jgi:hypothetical protein
MVRRRSTVRFRKGAPGYGYFSNAEPSTFFGRVAFEWQTPLVACARGVRLCCRGGLVQRLLVGNRSTVPVDVSVSHTCAMSTSIATCRSSGSACVALAGACRNLAGPLDRWPLPEDRSGLDQSSLAPGYGQGVSCPGQASARGEREPRPVHRAVPATACRCRWQTVGRR